MNNFFYAARLKCLFFVFLFSCVVSVCLSSCAPVNNQIPETTRVLSNYANFPNTMTLNGFAVDYPEGFNVSKSSDSTLIVEDVCYSGRQQTISNGDYSTFFLVEVFSEIGLDDVEKYFVSHAEMAREDLIEPSEAVPEFNIPEGFNLLFFIKEPEPLILNGSRALLVVIGRTDIEGAFVYDCYVSVSENSVGRVRVGYIDKEYEENSALFDGVIASVRVDNGSN